MLYTSLLVSQCEPFCVVFHSPQLSLFLCSYARFLVYLGVCAVPLETRQARILRALYYLYCVSDIG